VTAIEDALARLRAADPLDGLPAGRVRDGFAASGAAFVAVGGPLESRWAEAVRDLDACVRPILGGAAVLNEGGVYRGSWMESTATINAELLSRFAPDVTTDTHLLFAEHQRADGMIPYKVTDAGPGFSQIQIVTPLARTVWNHYLLAGRDRDYLRRMYDAMARYDQWLATYRNTRGTGAVEAFCTFDTGHDLSPRFWFAPDRAYQNEATLVDPASPTMPYVAPDLTANVACQRVYLGRIATELGEDGSPWQEKAAASLAALEEQCWDEADGTFYDRDRSGEFVRVLSDVLLRVLACEVGDDAFFAEALERHLMSTRRFLSHYGFTSLAMDDPRFDADYTRNSWGGPVNFLSQVRAPHAFEHHGRVAELGIAAMPVLDALAGADRFPQCLDPWSGEAGYTEVYSPSILWFLDAIERWCGILERPDGELWFSGLTPTRLGHAPASAVAYTRIVDGVRFELAADDTEVVVYRDGAEHLRFPRGWRVVADRTGRPVSVVGLAAAPIAGELRIDEEAAGSRFELDGNAHVALDGAVLRHGGVVLPRF
jgi:hypothetical protein